MRYLPLLALCLVAAAPVEKKPAKSANAPKTATVKTLVEVTLTKGAASTLDNPMAAQLGYAAPMPIRDFQVADTSKDTQLASVVVLADGKAAGLVLSSTTVTGWDGARPVAIDGYSCRTDLSGKLISAVRASGRVGAISQTKVSGREIERFTGTLLKSILSQPSVANK